MDEFKPNGWRDTIGIFLIFANIFLAYLTPTFDKIIICFLLIFLYITWKFVDISLAGWRDTNKLTKEVIDLNEKLISDLEKLSKKKK